MAVNVSVGTLKRDQAFFQQTLRAKVFPPNPITHSRHDFAKLLSLYTIDPPTLMSPMVSKHTTLRGDPAAPRTKQYKLEHQISSFEPTKNKCTPKTHKTH